MNAFGSFIVCLIEEISGEILGKLMTIVFSYSSFACISVESAQGELLRMHEILCSHNLFGRGILFIHVYKYIEYCIGFIFLNIFFCMQLSVQLIYS